MKNAKEAFNNFNTMNRAGRQFLMSMMGQRNPSQFCKGMPFGGMPDMQNIMAGMQQMGQKMGGMMPNMQGQVQNAAQNMMPIMQQQMTQMIGFMAQMNQTALGMMQMMFEQNCKMMNQFMDAANTMAGAGTAKGEESAESTELDTVEAEE